MLESISVPRRSYDFEDYIDILRRNLRWLIAPAFAGLVIATVVAYSKQDTYISSGSIRVVPQQITPEVVKSLTTQDMSDRINGMAQNILSRNTLTSIINNFGLYKNELKSEPMEDVLDLMRHSIPIRPTEGIAASGKVMSAMQISFIYPDRYMAQKVCQDLITRFINASSEGASESLQGVHAFLQDELAQAKKQLDEVDGRVAAFQTKNAGRMPEDIQMNLQQMNAFQSRYAGLSEALNRIAEQKMILDSQMSMAKDRLAAVKTPEAAQHSERLSDLNRQISELEIGIKAMRGRYTEDYPDLQNAKERLAFLKDQRESALKEKVSGESSYDPSTATAERRSVQEQITDIQTREKALAIEAADIKKQMASVNSAIAGFSARLQGLPAGQKEWSDLLREQATARGKLQELTANQSRSTLAIDLNNRRQGETLELVDAASLPTAPFEPKRAMVLPMGAFIGLVLGIIIVAVREVKDTSLKSLKDARLYTQLNILGSVPLLENDVVVQRRKQMMWVGWTAATIAGLAIMTISVAHYYLKG